MLMLTIIVAALLFGVLGPRLMGGLDRFLAHGGFFPEEDRDAPKDAANTGGSSTPV